MYCDMSRPKISVLLPSFPSKVSIILKTHYIVSYPHIDLQFESIEQLTDIKDIWERKLTISNPRHLRSFSSFVKSKSNIMIYLDLACVYCQQLTLSVLRCQNNIKKHKKRFKTITQTVVFEYNFCLGQFDPNKAFDVRFSTKTAWSCEG